MKTLCICLLITKAALVQAFSQNLDVQLIGVRSNKGVLLVRVQNEQKKIVQQRIVNINKPESVSLSFVELPKGKLSVSILHDENNNKKMDFGMFGIPKEGWGVSNDARGFMSAPKFEDQLFDFQANKNIAITMKY
jgi:uncharacterized protein (DUF2141 family)